MNLRNLINVIPEIEKLFHSPSNLGVGMQIYDIEKFVNWKTAVLLELQTNSNQQIQTFVDDTIHILNKRFNGIQDDKYFKEVKGRLNAINNNSIQLTVTESKKPRIFISHSTNDKAYVEKLVDLFLDMGLDEDGLFCSSYPGFGIPLGEDVYEYLEKQFEEYDIYVIFILSDNYYRSAASLNEMGATWILKKKYLSILLPSFEFRDIRGVINPNKIAIKLDGDEDELISRLGELKEHIISMFSLKEIKPDRWERKRNEFINSVLNIKVDNKIDDEALSILKYMEDSDSKRLIISSCLEGVYYQAGNVQLNNYSDDRDIAKIKAQIKSLAENEYIEALNPGKTIYGLTDAGYIMLEENRK